MTTSKIVSNKTIDIVFKVFLKEMNKFETIFKKRCDTDGNGKLDYQEFKAMIMRSKVRKEELAIKEEEKERRKPKTSKKEASKSKGKKGKGKP